MTAAQELAGAQTPAVHFKRSQRLKMEGKTEKAPLVALYATCMVCLTAQEFGCKSAFMPLEPKSQKQAMRRSDWDQWSKTEAKELATLWEMGVFEVVDKPKNYDPVGCKWTYKLKVQDGNLDDVTYKARLVLEGDTMYDDEYGETYCPTAKMWAVRMLAGEHRRSRRNGML